MKNFYLIFFFSFGFLFSEETLANWPCTYLDPELVYRINPEEIHTIVEIGSYNGLNAIQLHQHYQCPVFTFECDPHCFQAIANNLHSYEQITHIPFGVWDKTSSVKFYHTNVPGTSSFLEIDPNYIAQDVLNVVPIKVITLRLDQWIENSQIKNMDLLCVDAPGASLNIFQSLGKYLQQVKYIILETKNKYLYKNEPHFTNVKEYLVNQGFSSFFDGFDLDSKVLFINTSLFQDRPENFLQFSNEVKVFNTPELAPLVINDINSELIYAAFENNHSSFHSLTASENIDINFQDANGNTPLMAAVLGDSSYPLKKLMQQKHLNLRLQNKNGSTALMVAVALGNSLLTQLILEDPRGLATIDAKNNKGMTAEDIAKKLRSSEIADFIYLKKNGIIPKSPPSLTEYRSNVLPQKVLVCGICKDIATFLPEIIKIMEKIGGLFADHRIIVYENNSTDGSKDILVNWKNCNPKVHIFLENVDPELLQREIINRDENGNFSRIELIARARNILLNQVMSPEYEAFPYVIFMDMDFLTPPPSESIIEIFESKREWDAVFAYGVSSTNSYWDWFALRDFNQPLGPELLGQEWFTPKRWSLKKTDQWCKVYSAFGGCGIYKKSSIRDCKYSGIVTKDLEELAKKIITTGKFSHHPIISKYVNQLDNVSESINIPFPAINLPFIKNSDIGVTLGNESSLIWKMNSGSYQYPVVCEHIPFHARMILKGHGKLFINPRFVFQYER